MSADKKSKMKSTSKGKLMPIWMSGIQAVTWIISRNEALTLDADPTRILGGNQRYKPENKKIFERAAASANHPNNLPIRTKRAGIGHPDDMGGVTLANLSLWVGSHLVTQQALDFLVQCARSGTVKTVHREVLGVPINPQAWAGATLIEGKDARILLMVDIKPARNSSAFGKPIEPLFYWNDITGLIFKPERPSPMESVDDWLHRYAVRYLHQHGQPLSRKQAEYEGGKQGYAVNTVRPAYSSLAPHLKNSARIANLRHNK